MRRIPWRRKWQPSPEFLPRESHAQRSLGVYSPWGCKVSDTTDPHTHTCRCLSPSSPRRCLSLWPALTSPPPPPINSAWGISRPTLSPHWEASWQTPGGFHQRLITERSEPWQPRGKPRPQASAPWPHRAPWGPTAFQVGKPRYGGSRRKPAWCDGGGRPPKLLLAPVPALG